MTSLFSRLQKLNKDGRTCQLCGGPVTVYTASEGTSSYESVPPNGLPAVLNLIEAAQPVSEWDELPDYEYTPEECAELLKQLGVLREALAVFVTPGGDRSTMSGQEAKPQEPT